MRTGALVAWSRRGMENESEPLKGKDVGLLFG